MSSVCLSLIPLPSPPWLPHSTSWIWNTLISLSFAFPLNQQQFFYALFFAFVSFRDCQLSWNIYKCYFYEPKCMYVGVCVCVMAYLITMINIILSVVTRTLQLPPSVMMWYEIMLIFISHCINWALRCFEKIRKIWKKIFWAFQRLKILNWEWKEFKKKKRKI
jgi:hypothetical protein